MRRATLLMVDLTLVALSAVAAGLVRDNLEINPAHMQALVPYVGAAVALGAPILLVFGLNRSVWRFSGLPDYVNVVSTSALIVGASLFGSFLINRQDGVARSLPLLHLMILIAAMVGVRVLSRVWHRRRRPAAPLAQVMHGQQRDGVLIVGLNALAELYIRAAGELGERAPRIEGLLGRETHHTGRTLQQHKVLGKPEDIGVILAELDVHGVRIDRIVIASSIEQLSPVARDALLAISSGTTIRLDFLPELIVSERAASAMPLLGLVDTGVLPARGSGAAAGDGAVVRQIDPAEVDKFARRPFWRMKRLFDIVLAVVMITLLLPLFVVTLLVVIADTGVPVMFWQQRPGLGGRPFRLYKFRTMSAKLDANGCSVPDDKRTSAWGRLLRRSRLDELPQLFNILFGDMSFVGPRPLLPVDQSAEFAARLLVRPGLTGWAQVHGGRVIGAEDKAALDVWYICKASPALDLAILCATVPMLVAGERSNLRAIGQAWLDLRTLGVWRGTRAGRALVPGE